MDTQKLAQRVEQACGELGLDRRACQTIVTRAFAGQLVAEAKPQAGDDVATLREENARLRADHERWQKTEREVMQLLGTTAPQKIVHDLRNVLNELSLLQALASDKV